MKFINHLLFVCLGFGAIACLDGPAPAGKKGTDDPDETVKSLSSLVAVEDCDEVLADLKAKAKAEMEESLDQNLQSLLDYGGWCMWEEDFNDYAPSDKGDSGSGDDSASEYSTTNTQVAGVDEADFLKNDGTYIYIVGDTDFQIIRAWPAETAARVSSTPVEGTPEKLYAHGDRAVIYSSLGSMYGSSQDYFTGDYYAPEECTYGYDCEFTGNGQLLKMTVLDITDKTQPRLIREITFSGAYLNSRRVDDTVYTVVTFPEQTIPGIRLWPEALEEYQWYCNRDDIPFTDEEVTAFFEAQKEENARIIDETSVTGFLPGIKDTRYIGGEAVTEEGLLEGCKNFYASQTGDGGSFLSLVSFKPADQGELFATTIFGKPGAVYANQDALYVAVRHYQYDMDRWFFDDPGDGESGEATTLHKFTLDPDANRTAYAGSGVVKGRILNQFAMDEEDGYLRIATTTGHVPDPAVHSTLSVVADNGGELGVVGQIDNIAPTEDIRSVRFDGNVGFIVTFKKTDPLFVIDLGDPANPSIEGELKIPGYSTYMHLMDDTHILSIGYDADDQGDFAWFQGIQLQIMDVSDLENPTLDHREVIGTRGSTSEAATNHLAFNYFAPKDLLALPMTICEESAGGGNYGQKMTFSGLLVYRVTASGGFQALGGIPHQPVEDDFSEESACYSWWTDSNSLVKRSIIMDDYVYSIDPHQINISNIDDLENPVSHVAL
jgi:hypothetical protein